MNFPNMLYPQAPAQKVQWPSETPAPAPDTTTKIDPTKTLDATRNFYQMTPASQVPIQFSKPIATTLSDNPLSPTATTINVADTTGFAVGGTLLIDSEVIFYTAKTPTSFTGCTRGQLNTPANSHAQGVRVIGSTPP